jgi:hypothetical protein
MLHLVERHITQVRVSDASIWEISAFAVISIPLGIISAVLLTTLFKWLWRAAGFDKLENMTQMILALFTGMTSGLLMQWWIGDFVSQLVGYNLTSWKTVSFTVFWTTIGTPVGFVAIISYCNAKGNGWKKFGDWLRVPNEINIDYNHPDFSDFDEHMDYTQRNLPDSEYVTKVETSSVNSVLFDNMVIGELYDVTDGKVKVHKFANKDSNPEK